MNDTRNGNYCPCVSACYVSINVTGTMGCIVPFLHNKNNKALATPSGSQISEFHWICGSLSKWFTSDFANTWFLNMRYTSGSQTPNITKAYIK